MGLLALLVLGVGASAHAQVTGGVAGYSEYYVPGGENELSLALRSMNPANGGLETHALISITAWADNTIVYYDGEYYYEPVTDGDEVVYKVVPPPPGV